MRSSITVSDSSVTAPAKKRMVRAFLLLQWLKWFHHSKKLFRKIHRRLMQREVCNKVNAISDLSEEELKATAWFMENGKQFLMLIQFLLRGQKTWC